MESLSTCGKKMLYQVSLYDNYGHSDTYIVVASHYEEAGEVAQKHHKEIFPPKDYEDMYITIDSTLCITSVYDLVREYNIYMVEKTPPVVISLEPTDYDAFSYAELQVICKRKRVKAYGKRDELVKRLKWADEHNLYPVSDPGFQDIIESKTIGDLIHLFPDKEQTPIGKLLNAIEQGISLEKPKQRFIDLLRSGREFDCEIIVDNSDTSASFVWDEGCKITPYGEEKFKEILEAEYTILPNGNIEIHSDNFDLGEYFVLAVAGHISNSEYIKLFGE